MRAAIDAANATAGSSAIKAVVGSSDVGRVSHNTLPLTDWITCRWYQRPGMEPEPDRPDEECKESLLWDDKT